MNLCWIFIIACNIYYMLVILDLPLTETLHLQMLYCMSCVYAESRL